MNSERPAGATSLPESADRQPPSAFGRDISAELFQKCLVYLFLLGLIIRAGFMVEHAQTPSFGVVTLDQKFYDTAARMLLAGEDLHLLRGIRPLLYPMFLAAWYKMGGQHGIDLAVAAQHLLGVLTGLLVAILGARLFQHRLSGLVGGTLYMLAPVPLYFEGELLVESSYTFLICVGLWLLLRSVGVRGWRGAWLWMACGALTVFAAQERPNLFIFMAVHPLFAGWQWWRERRPSALLPLAGLAGGLLMAIPWGFVNKMQSNRFQPMPSEGGVNLYLGNKRTADGMVVRLNRRVSYSNRYEDSVEIWAREGYQAAMREQGRVPEDNPMAVSHYWMQRAIDEIKAAPMSWLHLMAKKTWLMMWNEEIPNNKAFTFLQMEYVWLRYLPARWFVLFMFAPAGIWAAVKWGNRDALFILLTYVFLYAGTNVIFFICDRYRYPIWPVAAALAGGGALALLEAIRRRFWTRTFGLATVTAAMAVISLYNWFGAQLPNFARDYLFRSVAWYEHGRFPQALADINQSVALDAEDVTALHHRGNVLLALKRYEEAGQDFESTLKIDATDAGVWNNYGIALEELGRTNQALTAFGRAIECHPPSQSAFFGMAFDQIRLGKFNEAARTMDQFDKTDKQPNAIALAIRSVLARQRGDATRADSLEQQARTLDASATTWAIAHASGREPASGQ